MCSEGHKTMTELYSVSSLFEIKSLASKTVNKLHLNQPFTSNVNNLLMQASLLEISSTLSNADPT